MNKQRALIIGRDVDGDDTDVGRRRILNWYHRGCRRRRRRPSSRWKRPSFGWHDGSCRDARRRGQRVHRRGRPLRYRREVGRRRPHRLCRRQRRRRRRVLQQHSNQTVFALRIFHSGNFWRGQGAGPACRGCRGCRQGLSRSCRTHLLSRMNSSSFGKPWIEIETIITNKGKQRLGRVLGLASQASKDLTGC